jgi:membrane protein implicated in regulation of membrane protease activity
LTVVTTQSMTVLFVVAAVVLSALEIAMPGFVLLPFGLGAVVAAVAGGLGATPVWQVVIFVVASFAFFVALRPLSRRLNEVGPTEGIGSERLIGAMGTVLEHIAAGETGMVRIDREEWRAEAANGQVLVPGMNVKVIEVRGTRVLVVVDHAEPLGRREGTHQ